MFQDSDFAGDLEDSKATLGGVLCIFGSTTFVLVLVSWMCKKQTAVSHSSTESDIISPNAGVRVEGLPALDLWDIVIEVLRSTNNNVQPSVTLHSCRFHVTHCAGYAILFHKDTYYHNIDVKSIYLHDTRRDLPDQVLEGELQGILSRASFDHQSAVRYLLRYCLYIPATCMPRRKASPRSSFSLFVPS